MVDEKHEEHYEYQYRFDLPIDRLASRKDSFSLFWLQIPIFAVQRDSSSARTSVNNATTSFDDLRVPITNRPGRLFSISNRWISFRGFVQLVRAPETRERRRLIFLNDRWANLVSLRCRAWCFANVLFFLHRNANSRTIRGRREGPTWLDIDDWNDYPLG